ncbi:MAG: alpha/beta hydrolase [Myxococcota bacterium]
MTAMHRDLVDLDVRVEGSGPPLLLVHGALCDGQLWDGVVARLRDRFTCIVPQMPLGSHRRPLPAGADRSPAGHAARLAALVDALGTGPVTLVGNDSGGAICQVLAAEHADRVERLILTNCDALDVFPPPAYAYLGLVTRIPGAFAAMALALNALPVLARFPTAYGWLADRLDSALLRSWIAPLRDPAVRADTAAFFRDVHPRVTLRAARQLARGRVPVHLLWGERDPFFRVSLAERLAAEVGATLDRLDARTYVPLDAPGALADHIGALAARAARTTA